MKATRVSLTVLVTTFNRPEKTQRALASLARAAEFAGCDLRLYVADASTDARTRDVVRRAFPAARLLEVSSEVFWAAGMRRAWEAAESDGFDDYLLWLNDDVVLEPHALQALLDTSARAGCGVVGGVMTDGDARVSYSGYLRGPRLARLRFRPLGRATDVQTCDALNGNLVLVSREVDARLGGFPVAYTHGMADFAYTLRARRHHIKVGLAPGTVGQCEPNSPSGTWVDVTLSRRERWRLLRSAKGLKFRDWSRFCLAFGGVSGPVYVIWPWLRVGLAR